MKLLFVCLGNICRSPAAEAIMQHKCRNAGIEVEIDSAGTYGGHSGEKADNRMRQAASKRGYELLSRSRQIRTDDFWNFDQIYVMDDSNYSNVCRLAPDVESIGKIVRITNYCTRHKIDHVPDPYYEGRDGFDLVLNILEDACDGILNRIKNVE